MAHALVTGGGGFIGSQLVRSLLEQAYDVTIVDRSSSQERLAEALPPGRTIEFVHGDLLDQPLLLKVMGSVDVVFHMAANSDISLGCHQTDRDLRLGTIATYHVLDAMRQHAVRDVVFASSSTVYGEPARLPSREDDGPLFPISLYGASKLACEGLISAFAHHYQLRGWIYRFGNVVGGGATHGVLVDFVRKLRRHASSLEILGDGKQTKPYLHVSDCVEGMLYGYAHAHRPLNYFNLTSQGVTSVDQIADIVVKALGLGDVSYRYTGGPRGWPGDVSQVQLDAAKLGAIGWQARLTSTQAVEKAVDELVERVT